MNICRYCGSPVPKENAICPNCGAHEFEHRCLQCGTRFSSPCCPQCGLSAEAEQHRCPNCGTRFFTNACPTCGYLPFAAKSAFVTAPQWSAPVQRSAAAVSPKSRTVALILLLFFGIMGIHRFYVGKIGSGILYLFTAGLFGIGWFIDLILIFAGTFRDRNGLPLVRW